MTHFSEGYTSVVGQMVYAGDPSQYINALCKYYTGVGQMQTAAGYEQTEWKKKIADEVISILGAMQPEASVA